MGVFSAGVFSAGLDMCILVILTKNNLLDQRPVILDWELDLTWILWGCSQGLLMPDD